MKQVVRLAPGMEIVHVVRDAKKWDVEPERTADGFDALYYGRRRGKRWGFCF